MKAFIWNRHFETGINSVDAQHKKLVELVNLYGEMKVENNLTPKKISEIITKLVSYTQIHFTDEEKIMQSRGIYDIHFKRHIKRHHEFIKEITYVVENIPEISNSYDELFDYLMHWLVFHILGMDQEMARQIKLIDSGMSPKDAYEMELDRESNASEPLLIALKGLFDQITSKNQKLINLNISLEEKVLERTKELRELNAHLEVLSYTDQLTGLKNRRFAMEQLKKLWEKEEAFGCLMIDADNFKQVNDNFGHDCGDIVLKELSEHLEDNIIQPSFICRLGGDEFLAIILNKTDIEVEKLALSIINHINRITVKLPVGKWEGSVSIGVGYKTPLLTDHQSLIKIADSNVYEAKRAGKGCYKYVIK